MGETIAVIAGDGDPKVMEAAMTVLNVIGEGRFDIREAAVSGDYVADHDGALPEAAGRAAEASQAVLFDYVNDSSWWSPADGTKPPPTAEQGLDELLGAHARIVPVRAFATAAAESPLDPALTDVRSIDFAVVHAIKGIYPGERSADGLSASDKIEYSAAEVIAVGQTAFDLAKARAELAGGQAHVTSADKSNVLETSRLWREVIGRLQKEKYPDVELDHQLADSAAMSLVTPTEFDVVVADALFGGILSAEAAAITTPKLVPSARVNAEGRGIFTPAYLAGKDNIAATLLSMEMMLGQALDRPQAGANLGKAVVETLDSGCKPPDLGGDSTAQEFADEVIERILPAGT